jgi:hypothetical protein
MPINSWHPLYSQHFPRWVKDAHAFGGEDMVKASGPLYLPELDQEDLYDPYKARATFPEIGKRTKEGLLGMVFRKDPEVKLPENLESLRKNASPQGETLTSVARKFLDNLLTLSRSVLLVDSPPASGPGSRSRIGSGGDVNLLVYDTSNISLPTRTSVPTALGLGIRPTPSLRRTR